jgi:hypothetical protein
MAMHIYMQPPPLQGVNPALPESLVQLVHRMLAKNRIERPSMAQVAQELDLIGSKASGMVPALSSSLLSGSHKASRPGTPAPTVNESATILSDNSQSNLLATRPLPPTGAAPASSRRSLPLVIGIAVVLLILVIGVALLLRNQTRQKSRINVSTVKTIDHTNATGTDRPPTPANKVRWRITSDPAGAAVHGLNNNQTLGTTPFDADREAVSGTIELELRLDGYKPAKLSLLGDKNQDPATVTLEQDKPSKAEPKKRERKHGKK